jgi:hypothetical protein
MHSLQAGLGQQSVATLRGPACLRFPKSAASSASVESRASVGKPPPPRPPSLGEGRSVPLCWPTTMMASSLRLLSKSPLPGGGGGAATGRRSELLPRHTAKATRSATAAAEREMRKQAVHSKRC